MSVNLLRKIVLLCALSSSGYAPPGAARELQIDELLQMYIVDLSKVNVAVASRREESISVAPSVINVISAREIKQFGAKNLQDILNRTTSLQGIGSHFYPNSISVRGQMLEHSNNDVLFLINGRPNRNSWNGGASERILLGFPVDAIDHIEIIRGPGSVLYGTGAFSGVINIVTKSTDSGKAIDVGVAAGSYDSHGVDATFTGDDDGLQYTAGFRGYHSGGWTFTATDENNVTESVKRGEQDKSAVVSGQAGPLSLNVLYTDVKLQGILGGPPNWPAGDHTSNHLMCDIGYRRKTGGTWDLDNHLTFNRFDFSFLDTPPDIRNRGSQDLLAESTMTGKIVENLNALMGATYEWISGTISPTTEYSSSRYSLFGQTDYTPVKALKISAGLQWNKVAQTGGNFSPRLGIVKNFTLNWGSKLLYSEAFRSAVATERFLPVTEAVVGNPSLKPETIRTAEFQTFFTSESSFAALTYFHSNIRNVIDRVSIGGGKFTFANVGRVNSHGVELEGKKIFDRKWTLIGSTTYQSNRDEFGNDASLAPKWMAKLGIAFAGSQGISVSMFDSYFGKPTPVSEVNPGVSEVNPEAKAYHLLTANLSANLRTLLGYTAFPEMIFSLYCDNLLDEEINYPEFNRQQINSIPIYSGRSVYATVSAKL
jgi:outer membrane receptor for ferrienterochelin and colicins